GGVEERVHGVGIALRLSPTFWTRSIHPVISRSQRGGAFRLQLQAFRGGKFQRQLIFRNRHFTTRWAVNNRNGRTPVALARNQPVAQPVIYCCPPDPVGSQLVNDGRDRVVLNEAV